MVLKMTNKFSTTFSESNSTDHASPMRFIYQDHNGKFKIDPQAIDALQKLKGPVGVVSLKGPVGACQGKNFILNQVHFLFFSFWLLLEKILWC